MKAIVYFSILCLFLGCRTKKNQEVEANTTTNETVQEMEAIKDAQLGFSTVSEDSLQSFSIKTVKIEGNTMVMEVEYGGGCEQHNFSLEGSKEISKSLPPIRAIKLISVGKVDKCRALVFKTLQFDLSNFAYQKKPGSVIFLTLEGWKERLEYKFVVTN